MLAHPQQALPDVGMQAGVDEGDAPVLDIGGMQLDIAAAGGEREVVRHALLVIEEVLANQIAAVAQAQDEILVPVVRVIAHQVPDQRPVADRDQRLRDGVRMLAQASAQTTAEQHHFHVVRASEFSVRSPAPSSASAAARTTANGRRERSAISSRERSPPDWLSTHIRACSNCPGPLPPVERYRPRLPSCGSHFGLVLRYVPSPSSASSSCAAAYSDSARYSAATSVRSSAEL